MKNVPLFELLRDVVSKQYSVDKHDITIDIKNHLKPVMEGRTVMAYEYEKPKRVTINVEIVEKDA